MANVPVYTAGINGQKAKSAVHFSKLHFIQALIKINGCQPYTNNAFCRLQKQGYTQTKLK